MCFILSYCHEGNEGEGPTRGRGEGNQFVCSTFAFTANSRRRRERVRGREAHSSSSTSFIFGSGGKIENALDARAIRPRTEKAERRSGGGDGNERDAPELATCREDKKRCLVLCCTHTHVLNQSHQDSHSEDEGSGPYSIFTHGCSRLLKSRLDQNLSRQRGKRRMTCPRNFFLNVT